MFASTATKRVQLCTDFTRRFASTDAKVVVVGAGTGGLTAITQLRQSLRSKGVKLAQKDIVIVDPAEYHFYQPGWTLVGSGLLEKEATRRPLTSLIPSWATHVSDSVTTFAPESNEVTLSSGDTLKYEYLIVAAGLQINWSAIKGLNEALVDSNSGVSSIYSYTTAGKTEQDIAALRSGKAIFTQPAGVIKCAGAPQKIMWQAWDRYRNSSRGETVKIEFWTGMPTMFAVPKYSEALNALRLERNIPAHFEHNLVAIDGPNRRATFKKKDGSEVVEEYMLLHVTPPQGPAKFIKESPLADGVGWVDVDQATLQHKKYPNIFSIGDASSLPTSKTAAAITAQAPVLAHNLSNYITGKTDSLTAQYDGYTSCPLLTGEGKLMLAEFKYGLQPKETFSIDQAKPQRLFYYFKTILFPYVYWNHMLKGEWFGASGFQKPRFP